MKTIRSSTLTPLAMVAMLGACGDDDPTGTPTDNEPELITTVNLTFTPSGGGDNITASFQDPDGPGGNAATVTDPAAFTLGTVYDLRLEFLDESQNPVENRTEEIEREAEEHQVFFAGSAVGTALDVQYADRESDYMANAEGADLPVGLQATVTATQTGSGVLQVVLKHQPPVNLIPVKTETSDINDGDTDIDVSFDVTVQ